MSAASFVTTILERTNMYDESTIKRIEQILKEQANLSSTDRYRKQAEYLYKQGRYRNLTQRTNSADTIESSSKYTLSIK